jgi:hypothetical protein
MTRYTIFYNGIIVLSSMISNYPFVLSGGVSPTEISSLVSPQPVRKIISIPERHCACSDAALVPLFGIGKPRSNLGFGYMVYLDCFMLRSDVHFSTISVIAAVSLFGNEESNLDFAIFILV